MITDQGGLYAPDRTRELPAGETCAPPTINLLIDFVEAGERLRAQLGSLRTREDAFDAFLLAAALHQVLEDHVHRDVYSLGKVAARLPRVLGSRTGEPAASAAHLLRAAGLWVRGRRASTRRLIGWGAELAAVVQRLAEVVVDGGAVLEGARAVEGAAVCDGAAPLDTEMELLAVIDGFPAALRRTVVRLPHCFRSFDQSPEDFARIVRSFSGRWPDRGTPLLVIGLRTAGSYLAPLVAAFLKAEGYRHLEVLTMRKEQDLLEHELRLLAAARERGSLVLIVDEPPRSGAQLVLAARELEVHGLSRGSLVLLVPLFGHTLPTALDSYQVVSLAWDQWTIQDRLALGTVRANLSALLPGCVVEDVERVDLAPLSASPQRGHVTALFRARLLDQSSGERSQQYVCLEGAGLGYLGRHALAVAAAVGDFIPRVYGLRDGLLYRAWLPEAWRQTSTENPALAERIAAYVIARNQALAVSEDVSRRLVGRDSAQDLVAGMLADAFGRAALVVRPVVQLAARQLLEATRPSVIDGSMTPDHWFAVPDDALAARKVDFHQRAFSNEDCSCNDPIYDLACAAAGSDSSTLGDELLRAYERLSGDGVESERWLLYQLLHLYRIQQREARAEGRLDRLLAAERAMARAYRLYLAEHFFSDLAVPGSGPLCAIDVDWVLEVRWLGFPAISPAGALALRALCRHGYRPLIVTGRSAGEVRERCRSYRLAGGVGGYGGVAYDHASARTRSLLTADDEALLGDLRAVLREVPQVYVDTTYEHTVRAYRLGASGTAGLDPATIDDALARVDGRDRLRVIPALSQTDVAVAGIDKGKGLLALADEFGERRVAIAVGDTIEDLPMLRLAEHAAAPANADAELRRLISARDTRIHHTKGTCGAGLLEVVTDLLGHAPGTCPACGTSRASNIPGVLLATVLGALEGGPRRKLRQATLLATRLAALEISERRYSVVCNRTTTP